MKIKQPVNHHIIQKLKEAGIKHDPSVAHVTVDADSYAHFLKRIACDYTHLSSEEQHALAISTCLTHPDHREKQTPPRIPIEKVKVWPWHHWLIIVIVLVMALTFTALARCQGTSQIDVITFKNAANTTVKSYAAPFTIKEGTGVTFSASGSVMTLNAAGGAGGYSTIQSAGAAITQRAIANFFGAIFCADNAGATRSDCTLAANAAVSNQFLTGIDASGNFLRAQPSYSNISGTIPAITNLATTSPITGGPITATGTIACATCVTSSVPGAGIAHFAGGTQAVTSSAVTSADTSGTFPSTPHALLDGSVDSDTAAGTVARGDIITGQSISPKWTRLAKGAANSLLMMDGTGTDIAWAVPLVKAQIPTTTVFNDQNNTYSSSTTQDFDTVRAAYWGKAPIIDVAEVGTGTDMGDKMDSIYSLAAYTSANCAILDLRGFTGAQADATVDALNNATRCTKWIMGPSTRLSLTKFWTIQTPATANQVAAPAAPTLATSTTGGSLAAATTYGVKVVLSNALLGIGEGSLPSTEATKLTGAGATNSITVTSPAASGDATCYYVYSATPVGSGWKLNNTMGCIPIGTNYVIQTVGAGAIPPTNAALFNGMYELDCNGATISLDSTQATIQFKTATPVYMHDCHIESTQTSSVVNATSIQISEASNASTHNANVLIDNVSIMGGGMGIVASAGFGTTGPVLNNIRIRNFRYGSPTMPPARGIYITGNGTNGSYASNVMVENVEILPSIWPTTSFYSAGVMFNPCVDCSVERVRCTNIDGTQSAFDSCVAVIGNNIAGTGSKNVNVSNVVCDNLTQVNCLDVNGFATNVNVDKVLCQNINTIVGITGTASPQADCVDVFMAARVNLNKIICQNLSPGTNLPPCLEIYESSEITGSDSQFTDSSGGIAIFGSPSTHLTNIVASRNWRSGIQISDHLAQVTCNTTTAVVWVSGNPFGPWMQGTQLTIAGTPFQVASVQDSQHMTLLTACSAGANQPQIVPTADMSLVNPKLDDNGKNGTGAVRAAPGQEGLYASGSTQITIIGGSANDNQPTASKSQQYGIRFENSARGRVIGTDTTNNVGGASCSLEYGANVAGNHGICDSPKHSSILIDDNVSGKWNLSASSAVGASLRIPNGAVVTTPVAGDIWNDSTMMQYLGPNNTLVQNLPVKIWLTGNYTNSTTSLTNVTSGNTLAFPVAASQTYQITCELYYQAASTGGLQIAFTGPASPTAINYSAMIGTTATTINNGESTAFGTKIPTTGVAATATTNFPAHISLTLRNGANAGTVTLQAASVAAVQLTINNTSNCTMQ